MNNMFQMVTLLWYHILLCLVPVCWFISMFTQVTLGFINLKFLFSPLLHRWDTAGQEKFKCIASAYYRGAEGENNINLILPVSGGCILYSNIYPYMLLRRVSIDTVVEWIVHYCREEGMKLFYLMYCHICKRWVFWWCSDKKWHFCLGGKEFEVGWD